MDKAAAMSEWRQIQGLLDKIRGTGRGGISADDPEVVTKLQLKLRELEQNQEKMKAVNAYYRKNKTLEGCPQLSAEEIERLKARVTKLSVEPVAHYNPAEIKLIRKNTGFTQAVFAQYMGVSVKTVEAWEAVRNRPEGAACRLLALTKADPQFSIKVGIVAR